MSNHPNRGPKGPSSNPMPEEVRAARLTAGLTQEAAASLIYSALRTWQDWESGKARMHPAAWELFGIKVAKLPKQSINREQLEEDAARYRWLQERERWSSVMVDFDRDSIYDRHRVVWYSDDGWRTAEGQSLDEAIDAAMLWLT